MTGTHEAQTATSAAPFVPRAKTVARLRAAAAACRGCALYLRATQTVFGEGSESPDVVVIGEQPGDAEDRSGHPFVGPAGRLLDRALADAGIARDRVYLTNAVKHFKWTARGKRRLHKRPEDREIAACRPWLEAELGLLRPRSIVCLGVSAAHAAFGRPVRLKDVRGTILRTPLCERTFVTTHPSALLRIRNNDDDYRAAYAAFVHDMRVATRDCA